MNRNITNDMSFGQSKFNTPTKEEENGQNKTVYNYYFNSENKNQNEKQRRKVPNQNNNDLDNFLQNQNNFMNFASEEQIEEDGALYIDDHCGNDINMEISNKTRVIKISKMVTFIGLGLMLFILVIHNIIQFNLINKQNLDFANSIETNQIILDSVNNELKETSQEKLTQTYEENGYNKLNNNDIYVFVPNEKEDPIIYYKQTNWFNEICDKLFGFLSK